MTAVVYTAQRSLIAGHLAGSVYTLNLQIAAPDGLTPRREVSRRRLTPISGKGSEVLRFFGRTTWDVRLAPMTGSALLAVREFLDSVEDAEFTFDAYGSATSPVSPVTVELITDGYDMTRVYPMHAGGRDDYHQISFQVAEL